MGTVRALLSTALVAVLAAACASAQPSIRQSCNQRTQWALAQVHACQECQVLAKAPRCECFADPVSGTCAQQMEAWVGSAECALVRNCVDACKDDCACVDACYDRRPSCRDVGGAADACVVGACDARCL